MGRVIYYNHMKFATPTKEPDTAMPPELTSEPESPMSNQTEDDSQSLQRMPSVMVVKDIMDTETDKPRRSSFFGHVPQLKHLAYCRSTRNMRKNPVYKPRKTGKIRFASVCKIFEFEHETFPRLSVETKTFPIYKDEFHLATRRWYS